MQWFAAHRPHVLEVLEEMIEALMDEFRSEQIYAAGHTRTTARRSTKHRSPVPSMTIELTGDLRYRSVRVYDEGCALAPIENRIGKHMADLMPPDLMVRVLRCLERAKREHRPRSFSYAVRGIPYRGTVIAPSDDTVVITVTRMNQN